MGDYPSIQADLSASVGPATSHWDEIDRLREAHRYFWNESAQGYWVLTRFDDIREAFQNPEVFGNHSIIATEPDPPYRFLPSLLEAPEHMKFRHVLNAWFAPAAIERFTPGLVALARDLVHDVAAAGSCDFTRSFGDHFPVRVVLHSMGLPPDAGEFLVTCVRSRSKARQQIGIVDPMDGWKAMAEHWTRLMEERRARPADPAVDLMTHLLNARIDDRPLADDEIIDLMVTLTIGGVDTLGAQLGWCMYHLAGHPEDRRRLVETPELIPTAIEEFLRAYPVVSMARKVKEDVDFHGCPMKKDDMVLVWGQAATRDPRVFPDADQVIIDRQPNRHIAFGASAHRCLGSHLARAELRVALEEWHRAIPEYRIDSAEPLLAHGGQITLLSLPLAWDS